MGGFSRLAVVLALVAAVLLTLPVPCPAQQRAQVPFSDEAVEKAIERGRQFLWTMYNEKQGHWPEPAPPRPPRIHGYHGGYSSLAMYALLAAGESPQEPRMKRALKWLAGVKMNATYCLGVRTQVWTYLPREQRRVLLSKDAKQLMASMSRPSRMPKNLRAALKAHPGYGTYNYISDGNPRGGDHSNTQFGILGVWAAARHNLEIPKGYWLLVYKHYEATQNRDGGWGYGYSFGGAAAGSKGTMTAAGLAGLFVAFDNLQSNQFTKCGANTAIAPIQKALGWMDRHYSPSRSFGGGPYYYYMYAVERVGLASGYKYFGKKDWYKLGATRLINLQGRSGGWGGQGFGGGTLVNTTFALLFLVRGRAPVLFNRLEYNGDWNNRPRALANLTRWTSRKFEGDVNWQIINLKVPVEEWHDAPILLITGAKAPTFTDQELDKLRQFVHQGGLILSVSECKARGRAFDMAMRGQGGIYHKLFPNYELKQLPDDHPIYTAHFRLRRRSPLWGVSNGVRLLALHTTEDLPLPWQTNAVATEEEAFRLAFNIVFYTTDRASLRHRGTSTWPPTRPIVPLRLARVARVRHNGNWDPEPLAWTRFAMLMGQKWQTKVAIEPVALAGLEAGRHRVAHITGTNALALTKAEKEALKTYVAAGGTLIMDAAGGSEAFGRSAVTLLNELFGKGSLRRLPGLSAVYRLPGMEIDKVAYRRAARKRLGDVKYPRIRGVTIDDRVAVFLSREDLTAALVGYACFTCIGYAPGTVAKPGSAIELMRNMVLYGNQVAKPGPAAKAQPVATK